MICFSTPAETLLRAMASQYGGDPAATDISRLFRLPGFTNRNLYNRELAPACDRIKEPRISWHAFRHTHATLLTDVGESIKTAQAQLGHSDLATTLNLYAHVVPDSQRRAVERVSEALFSIVLKLDDGAKNGRIN